MAGPTDMVGQLFIIASDKTQIEVGETVHFSISYDENRTPENDIDIYINNDFLESIPVTPSPVLFSHTFEEDGIFYLYATTVGTPESNTIAINVDEATPQTQSNSVSWIINNKIVSSLEMNNKEIQSIVTSDNVVLYNINSPEYDAISLSSDKNILSYADGDTCILTAQLTKNGSPSLVEGETVSFYNGATLLGTDDTDSNGIATLTYTSAGVGDMSIIASVDSVISSETYSIRDAIKYISGSITSSQTISVPNLPTNFKCEFKVKGTTDNVSGFAAWVEVGSDSNNLILFGRTTSTSYTGILVKVNGYYEVIQRGSGKYQSDDVLYSYTYENGSQAITDGTQTVTANNSQITNRNYVNTYIGTNMYIKELTFLPL